jgi:hypothetical protein
MATDNEIVSRALVAARCVMTTGGITDQLGIYLMLCQLAFEYGLTVAPDKGSTGRAAANKRCEILQEVMLRATNVGCAQIREYHTGERS